jgi:hypothetical protein
MVAQPNNPDTMNSHRGRKIIKRISLGPDIFPYQCTVGLRIPQSDISVWLHGIEAPRDDTSINVIARTRPLVIGIGSDNKESRPFATHQRDRREIIHTVQSGKVRKSAIEQLLVLKDVAVFRWENAEVEQSSRTR